MSEIWVVGYYKVCWIDIEIKKIWECVIVLYIFICMNRDGWLSCYWIICSDMLYYEIYKIFLYNNKY